MLDAKETNAAQLQQELQQSISRLEGSRVDYVEVGRLQVLTHFQTQSVLQYRQ